MTRLNLGAGDERRDGWVNVDLREDVADVVCDVTKLEHWGDESVDEVRALDLLEHFPHYRTQEILAEWRRVLVADGILTIKVPNIVALAQQILNAPHREALYVRNIYGAHRWGPDGAWDTHHWAWSPETIATELAEAGFSILALDNDLNMTVRAAKV